MKKRMLSGFLSSLFAVAFIFSQIGTVVEAYTNGHSASDAVAWANSQINKGLDYDGVYGWFKERQRISFILTARRRASSSALFARYRFQAIQVFC